MTVSQTNAAVIWNNEEMCQSWYAYDNYKEVLQEHCYG